MGVDVLMDLGLPLGVNDAHMHAPGMQINAAIESVLLLVESSWPPWKMDAMEPAVRSVPETDRLRAFGHRHNNWERRRYLKRRP